MDAALGPAIPFINVKIGSADRRDFHFHKDVGASEGWDFYLADIGAWSGFRLHYRQHGFRHESCLMNMTLSTQTIDSNIGACGPLRSGLQSIIPCQNDEIWFLCRRALPFRDTGDAADRGYRVRGAFANTTRCE